jgi:hypothetical protein
MTTEVKTDAPAAPARGTFVGAIKLGAGIVVGAVATLFILGFVVGILNNVFNGVSWRNPLNIAPTATAPPISTQPGSGYTNHGRNGQCDGRPKYTAFTCVSPGTGRTTTCFCD